MWLPEFLICWFVGTIVLYLLGLLNYDDEE